MAAACVTQQFWALSHPLTRSSSRACFVFSAETSGKAGASDDAPQTGSGGNVSLGSVKEHADT